MRVAKENVAVTIVQGRDILFARGFSLADLSKFLKVKNPKLDFDDFAGPVTNGMIEYAVRDVQTTWECYLDLKERLAGLGLPNLLPEKAYSEASIGKANLKQMGVVPWQTSQPGFSRPILANILSSYFGGRSEVRIRRELRQVMMCDFLSMYPTVCTLMGLWRFVIADGMTMHDATHEAESLLESADLAWLQRPQSWQRLAMLVRVKPQGDTFPVRAAYGGQEQSTIGLNHLTSDDTPLWSTLADCIASKLLTGKAPQVLEATAFVPGERQAGLNPINVSGKDDYRVDPNTDDLFKRVIELRQSVKDTMKGASGDERDALDTEQNALKILANATSYGIYVVVNVARRAAPIQTTVYSSTSQPYKIVTDKVEETGPYFHPLLATLITGAARLMLAIAERHVTDNELEWSFCDTDSMAIAKPDHMDREIFTAKMENIVCWFEALNPYDFGGSILKIEPENFALDTGKSEPLYCWAVSAKRYALLNLDAGNTPIMRKVSAHGLGHLRPPFDESNAPVDMPKPHHSVLGKGIAYWHVDLWWRIVKAALAGTPNQVPFEYNTTMQQPAISHYGATSPELLRWFKHYNANRNYRHQVKPFGFLLAMTITPFPSVERMLDIETGNTRRKKALPIKPVAAYNADPAIAAASAFCRDSGEPITTEMLKTYAETLAQYHLHPEAKFLNGDYSNAGITKRRHIQISGIRNIGKESNDWETQAVLGFDPEATPDYGMNAESIDALVLSLRSLITKTSLNKTALTLELKPAQLRRMINGKHTKADRAWLAKCSVVLDKANSDFETASSNHNSEIRSLEQMVQNIGLRPTAKLIGVDPSNLRRKLNNEFN
jgi:DNA polymerase family B